MKESRGGDDPPSSCSWILSSALAHLHSGVWFFTFQAGRLDVAPVPARNDAPLADGRGSA